MVSFIIPYREQDRFRKANIDFLINRFKCIKIIDSEIIVVEHDITEKYQNPFVKKIFIKSDGIFNKGVCCNAGAKIARNTFLFFNDCDIIMPERNYIDALKEIIDFDVVNPYSEIRYNDRSGNYEKTVIPSIISGGAFLVRKSVFNEVKGFDENCVGFGYEDTIFDTKIQRLGYKIKTLNENYCIHLYHPAPKTPDSHESLNEFINNLALEDEYYRNFMNNKKLYESYLDMSIEELRNKLNGQNT